MTKGGAPDRTFCQSPTTRDHLEPLPIVSHLSVVYRRGRETRARPGSITTIDPVMLANFRNDAHHRLAKTISRVVTCRAESRDDRKVTAFVGEEAHRLLFGGIAALADKNHFLVRKRWRASRLPSVPLHF
jgi:hypothetical protein